MASKLFEDPQEPTPRGSKLFRTSEYDESMLGLVSSEQQQGFKGDSDYDQNLTFGSNQNQLRASNQGVGREIANGLARVIPNAALGIIGNVGSIIDLEDYWNQDKEVGNDLVTWSESMKEGVNDTFPIHRENPSKSLDWGDSAYAVENLSSLADSVFSFLATGAGVSGAVGKVAQALRLGKAGQFLQVGATAITLNQAEAVVSASQVYKQVYNQKLEEGLSDDEAKQTAADAASYVININRLNIPLNLTSSMAFLRTPKATRTAFLQASKTSTAKRLLSEGSQEYGEEVINYIAEQEGRRSAQKGYQYDVNRSLDDIFSREGFEAGLLGFIGGAGQSLATHAKNKIDGTSKFNQERYTAQQLLLEKYKSLTGQDINQTLQSVKTKADLLNQIQDAANRGDDSLVGDLQSDLLHVQALEAFEGGTTDKLIQVYKDVLADPKKEEKFGKDVVQRTTEAIRQIERGEDIFNALPDLENKGEVYYNRMKQNHLKDANLKLKSDIAKQVQEVSFAADAMDEPIDSPLVATFPEQLELNRMRDLYQRNVEMMKSNHAEYLELMSPKTQQKIAQAKNDAAKGKIEETIAQTQRDYSGVDFVGDDDIETSIPTINQDSKLKSGEVFNHQGYVYHVVSQKTQDGKLVEVTAVDADTGLSHTINLQTNEVQKTPSQGENQTVTSTVGDQGEVPVPDGISGSDSQSGRDLREEAVLNSTSSKPSEGISKFKLETGGLLEGELADIEAFHTYLITRPDKTTLPKLTLKKENGQSSVYGKYTVIIDDNGLKSKEAKGTYSNKTIRISKDSSLDTVIHEVLHGVIDELYQEDKTNLYAGIESILRKIRITPGINPQVLLEDSSIREEPEYQYQEEVINAALGFYNGMYPNLAREIQTTHKVEFNNLLKTYRINVSEAVLIGNNIFKDKKSIFLRQSKRGDNTQFNIYSPTGIKVGYLPTPAQAKNLSQSTRDNLETIKNSLKDGQEVEFKYKIQSGTPYEPNPKSLLERSDDIYSYNHEAVIFRQTKGANDLDRSISAVLGTLTQEDNAAILNNPNLTDSHVMKISDLDGKPRYIPVKPMEMDDSGYEEMSNILNSQSDPQAIVNELNTKFFIPANPLNGKRFHLQFKVFNGKVTLLLNENSKNSTLQRIFPINGIFNTKEGFLKSLKIESNKNAIPIKKIEDVINYAAREIPPASPRDFVLANLRANTTDRLFGGINIVPDGIVKKRSIISEENQISSQPIPVQPTVQPTSKKTLSKNIVEVEKPKSGIQLFPGSVSDIDMDGMLSVNRGEVRSKTDWSQVKSDLESILPKGFGLDRLAKIAEKNKLDGSTMGVFTRNVVYLADLTAQGTHYHEAFHAIFRKVFNQSEQQFYYRIAKTKIDTSILAQERFLKENPHYEGRENVEGLMLEEYMSDLFQAYMNGKPTTILGKMFRFIKDLVNSLMKRGDELTSLFSRIDSGEFTFRSIKNPSAFGIDEVVYKRVPFAQVQESNELVRLLTIHYLENKTSYKEMENQLDKILLGLKNESSVDFDTLYEQEVSKIGDEDQALESLGQLWYTGVVEDGEDPNKAYRKVYAYEESTNVLKDQVKKNLKALDNAFVDKNDLTEDEVAVQTDEVTDRNWEQSPFEVNPTDDVSADVKVMINYTGYYLDGKLKPVDSSFVYNTLLLSLSGLETYDQMYNRLAKRSENNPQIAGIKRSLDNQVSVDPTFKTKFQQSFSLEKVEYTQIEYTENEGKPSTFKVFSANRKDTGDIQLNRWRNQYVKLSKSKVLEGLKEVVKSTRKLSEGVQFNKSYDKTDVGQYLKDLSNLGITLDQGFVEDVLDNLHPIYSWKEADLKRSFTTEMSNILDIMKEGNPFGDHSIIIMERDSPKVKEEKQKLIDATAITRLRRLGAEDAKYRTDILMTSFQNSENKTVYPFTAPSHLLTTGRKITEKDPSLLAKFQSAYYQLNPFIDQENRNSNTLQKLKLSIFNGIRESKGEEGQTFKNIDSKSYHLSTFSLWQSGFLNPFQIEAKSISSLFQFPQLGRMVEDGKIAPWARVYLRNFYRQDQQLIQDSREELKNLPLDQLIEGYHFAEARIDKKVVVPAYINGVPNKDSYQQILDLIKAGKLSNNDLPRGFQVKQLPEMNTLFTHEAIVNGEVTDADIDLYYDNLFNQQLLPQLKSLLRDSDLDPNVAKERNLYYDPSKGGFKTVDDFLMEFLMEDFVYSNSYAQLHRGPEQYYKGGVDITKRAAGQSAAGRSLMDGEFHVALLTTQKVKKMVGGKEVTVDPTDAQGHMSGKRHLQVMEKLGRLTPQVRDQIERLIAGEEIEWMGDFTLIPWKNVFFNGEEYIKTSTLPLFKSLTSIRNEYFDPSKPASEKNSQWIARPGMEYLHNLREEMDGEEYGVRVPTKPLIDEAYYDTAFKKNQKSKNFPTNGKWSNLKTIPLQNKDWRLQVENPSGKTKVTYGTQLLQLIDSEMSDDHEVEFQGQMVPLMTVRNQYQSLLSDIREDSMTKALDLMDKAIDGDNLFINRLTANLEASKSDNNSLEFFSQSEGKFKYSTDLPNLQTKFEEMFLSYFSKSVFNQKTSGLKLTLVSSFGVKNPQTGEDLKIHRLEGGEKVKVNKSIRDMTGKDISNLANTRMKELLADTKFPIQPGEVIFSKSWNTIDEFEQVLTNLLYEADHPSTPSLRSAIGNYGKVGFHSADVDGRERAFYKALKTLESDIDAGRLSQEVEEYQGGKIELAEIILSAEFLSDYDLTLEEFEELDQQTKDEILTMVGYRIPTQSHHSMIPFKVVGFVPAYYGSIAIAPSEITYLSGADYDVDSLFVHRKEFRVKPDGSIELFHENKSAEALWEDYLAYNLQFNPDVKSRMKDLNMKDPMIGVKMAVKDILGMDKEKFMSNPKLTNAARYNKILDTQLSFLTNVQNAESLFTPASIDSLKDIARDIYEMTGENEELIVPYQSYVSRYTAWINNSTGKSNVGNAASANKINAFLTKYGVELVEPVQFDGETFTGYADTIERDVSLKDGKVSGRITRRKGDSLSTVVSAMTDNAKERLAAKLNLTKNNLSVFSNMISLGMGLNRTMLMAKQPVMVEITKQFTSKSAIIASPGSSYGLVEKYLLRLDDLLGKNNLVTTPITSEGMIDHINDNLILDSKGTPYKSIKGGDSANGHLTPEDIPKFQWARAILLQYQQLSDITDDFTRVGKLLSLDKEIGIEFTKMDDIFQAHKTLTSEGTTMGIESALWTDKNVTKNLENLWKVKSKAEGYFLSRTPRFQQEFNRLVDLGVKNQSITKLRKDYVTYLGLRRIEADLKTNNKSLSSLISLIHSGEDNITSQFDKTLSKFPELKENKFIGQLQKETPRENGNHYYRLSYNTRMKNDPLFTEELQNGYKALQSHYSPEVRKFATTLFNYLTIKDSLNQRNESFIKLINPTAFQAISLRLKGGFLQNGNKVVGTKDLYSIPLDPVGQTTNNDEFKKLFKSLYKETPVQSYRRFVQLFFSQKANREAVNQFGNKKVKGVFVQKNHEGKLYREYDFSKSTQEELTKMGIPSNEGKVFFPQIFRQYVPVDMYDPNPYAKPTNTIWIRQVEKVEGNQAYYTKLEENKNRYLSPYTMEYDQVIEEAKKTPVRSEGEPDPDFVGDDEVTPDIPTPPQVVAKNIPIEKAPVTGKPIQKLWVTFSERLKSKYSFPEETIKNYRSYLEIGMEDYLVKGVTLIHSKITSQEKKTLDNLSNLFNLYDRVKLENERDLDKVHDDADYGNDLIVYNRMYSETLGLINGTTTPSIPLPTEPKFEGDIRGSSSNTLIQVKNLKIGDTITVTVSGRRTSTFKTKIKSFIDYKDGAELYHIIFDATGTRPDGYMVNSEGIINFNSDEVLAYIHLDEQPEPVSKKSGIVLDPSNVISRVEDGKGTDFSQRDSLSPVTKTRLDTYVDYLKFSKWISSTLKSLSKSTKLTSNKDPEVKALSQLFQGYSPESLGLSENWSIPQDIQRIAKKLLFPTVDGETGETLFWDSNNSTNFPRTGTFLDFLNVGDTVYNPFIIDDEVSLNQQTIDELNEIGLYDEKDVLDYIENGRKPTIHREVLISTLDKLSKRFGIPYILDENLSTLGRVVDGKVYINPTLAKSDTPFHEFAHPFIHVIKKENPILYRNLVKQILAEGKILRDVQRTYPDLSPSDQIEEAIVTAIGQSSVQPKGLMEAIRQFFKRLVGYFKALDIIIPANLNPNTTLRELGVIVNGDSHIDLTSTGLQSWDQRVLLQPIPQSPLGKVIDDIKILLERQIGMYKKRVNTDSQKKYLAKLESLSKSLTDDITGVSDFVTQASTTIHNLRVRMDGLSTQKSNSEQIRELVQIAELSQSFNLLDDIKTVLRGELGDQFRSSPFVQTLKEAISEREDLMTDYMEKGIPLLANYLYDQYDDSLNSTLTGDNEKFQLTKEKLISQLKENPKDISTIAKLLFPAINTDDAVLSLFAKGLKRQLDDANQLDIAVEQRLVSAKAAYVQESGISEDKIKRLNEPFIVEADFQMGNDKVKRLRLLEVNDPGYKSLSPAAKDYHTALKDVLMASQQNIPESSKLGLWLPGIRKSPEELFLEKKFAESIKEKGKELTTFQVDDSDYGLQTLSGDQAKFIPIYYTSRLEVEETSNDLLQSIMRYSQSTNKYRAYNEVSGEVNLAMDLLASRDTLEVNSKGDNKSDSLAKKLKIDRFLKKPGTSNTFERFKSFVDMVYYGESEDKITVNVAGREWSANKVFGSLASATSIISLSGNLLQAINNVTVGNYMTILESVGGRYFNKKDLAKAAKEYWFNVPQMVADIQHKGYKSKVGQLMDMYDAIQGQFRDEYGKEVSGSVARKLMSTSTLFFFQKTGEHQIQVTNALAFLQGQKVMLDGKTIPLYEAYELDSKGKLKLKDGVEWTNDQRRGLMNKIHKVNKESNGVYNKFDSLQIQKSAWGKMALIFRKFIVPTIRKRYDGLRVDYEENALAEGYYRTMFRFLSDYKNFKSNVIDNWSSLQPFERENIRKTILELGTMVLLFVAMLGLTDDDDEEKEGRSYISALTLYEAKRLQSDLMFYTPGFGLKDQWRVLKSPTALYGTVEKTASVLGQALYYNYKEGEFGFTEEYKRDSGLNQKGDSKLWAKMKKVIPVVSKFELSTNPEEAYKSFLKANQ